MLLRDEYLSRTSSLQLTAWMLPLAPTYSKQ
jgi:hypothetical protein